MKTGTWYVAGFVVAFIYFYVYAVNHLRGVRADPIEDRGARFFNPQQHRQPWPQQRQGLRPQHGNPHHHRQGVAQPQLSWQYHNYTSMTTFLRQVCSTEEERRRMGYSVVY